MTSLIERYIGRRVAEVAPKIIERHIDAAVARAMENSPLIQFIKTMQMQMLACDPKMDPREAWNAARESLRAFLDDEECEFGDPRFDWSRDGAVTLIHEYEIHHWEPKP